MISWDDLNNPKIYGVLGFMDFRKVKQTILGKRILNHINYNYNIWNHYIAAKYGYPHP